MKKLTLFAFLITATGFIVGCGDDGHKLSNAEYMAFKQWQIQQQYGGGSNTTTSTSTIVQYVTVTSITTVTR